MEFPLQFLKILVKLDEDSLISIFDVIDLLSYTRTKV
jgi:hypothetical protein